MELLQMKVICGYTIKADNMFAALLRKADVAISL